MPDSVSIDDLLALLARTPSEATRVELAIETIAAGFDGESLDKIVADLTAIRDSIARLSDESDRDPEGFDDLFEAVELMNCRDSLERFDRVGELIAKMFPELNARDAYTLREMLLMQSQYTRHQIEHGE